MKENKDKRKLKLHIGNLMIILGSIIFITSLLLAFRWKGIQDKYISKHDDIIEANEYEKEESALIRDESYIKESMYDNNNKEEFNEKVEDEIEDTVSIEKIERDKYKDGMMVIEIPKIEVKAAVMSGTSEKILKEGPGLYEISPLPYEEGGNVLIAGHRTTYGAWFRHVDELEKGDVINLEIDGLKYIYKVEKVFIVAKNDWSVTESTGYSALTLTACHPLRSNKQRIIVRAKLEKDE